MKNFAFLIVFIGLTSSVFGQNWLDNIDKAKATAETENKYILLSFSGSDWCAPCIRLEHDLYSTDSFKAFAEQNLVLLKADFPMKKKNKLSEAQTKHNEALAEKYNPKGAFPMAIILNYNGEVIGQMKHPANSTEQYINHLKTFIQ